jgi:hypothetical protein
MGTAQTGSMRMLPGLWDRITTRSLCVNSLERQPQKVTALYCRDSKSGGIPSSTGHGKSDKCKRIGYAIVRTMGFSLLIGIDRLGEPESQFRIIIDTNLLYPNRAGVSAHALPVGGCRASVREVRLSAGVTKQIDSRSAWNRACHASGFWGLPSGKRPDAIAWRFSAERL